MSKSIESVSPFGPPAKVIFHRINFVPHLLAGVKGRREFRQPRRCYALDEIVAWADVPSSTAWPEPTNHLFVALIVGENSSLDPKMVDSWFTPPDHPEAEPSITMERDGYTIHWRPGRALVQGALAQQEEILAALTEFAFYEGELRNLEWALEGCETDALADVCRSQSIRYRDRSHWERLREKAEECYRLRLVFARLEPRLAKGSGKLSRLGRRLMARLLARADVSARLEAFSDRLEACGDLYEGANDRVADYRWYFSGHLLELGIIVFLLLEVVLMAAELFTRYLEMVAE